VQEHDSKYLFSMPIVPPQSWGIFRRFIATADCAARVAQIVISCSITITTCYSTWCPLHVSVSVYTRHS